MPPSAADLRVGVIGLGARGYLADHAHRPGRGARVVAVADTATERLAGIDTRFPGAHSYASYRELLAAERLDAVIVMAPDHLHLEIALATLAAGAATYLEKPMSIDVEGCDAILRAAMETGTRLYVGHNMRHMPVVATMRDLVRDGAVGEVKAVWCRHFVGHGGDFYFKDWMSERRYVTGLLLQKGAHDLDVIHWLTGASTTRVSALGSSSLYGQVAAAAADTPYAPPAIRTETTTWPPTAQTGLNPALDVEDLSMMMMELDGGQVLASYQQCHFTPDYWRNYTVIGTEGRIENFGDTEGAVIRLWNSRHDYAPAGDREYVVATREGTHGGADATIMAEFLEFARTGGATLTSPVAARQAVAAASLATASLRDGGRPRDVPPVDARVAAYFAAGQRHEPEGS
ncbi:Gfo/Idh/MocA family oxidoreductase [Nocardioides carbamazepini]|uniref:Gfo/Idh/MocA family protein n=1 Tax=Nocardioides carbamazepini TaxID=2854259 RepID=UPI00214A2A95|nr:Gfo/Idh/MocA family oxidoreductase [Nocardioides carbamazepini]MCR1781887.1 Gfo/Idh/MocA family oxidoreductase [Nocardioides carbamazepini]